MNPNPNQPSGQDNILNDNDDQDKDDSNDSDEDDSDDDVINDIRNL